MKRDTKKILVGASIAGGALLLGTILFWPKSAAAGEKEIGLPVALDVNLSAKEKRDVANLIYNEHDPSVLAKAAWRLEEMGAPIAAKYVAQQALSIIKPQLDAEIELEDVEVLWPLYVWTDPVQIQSYALVLQSKGAPKTAALVMARAVALSKGV